MDVRSFGKGTVISVQATQHSEEVVKHVIHLPRFLLNANVFSLFCSAYFRTHLLKRRNEIERVEKKRKSG